MWVATNLALDDRLLELAVEVGGKTTKKAAVTEALEEYIRRRRQVRVVELFGTIDFEKLQGSKSQRRRR